MFGAENSKYFKDRLSWNSGFAGIIHDASFPLFFNDMNGNPIDGFVRYTTAGVQINGHIGYNFLNDHIHELKLKFGVFFRYQSSSLYDDLSVFYPPITGLTRFLLSSLIIRSRKGRIPPELADRFLMHIL
jgi:hypothetical protein